MQRTFVMGDIHGAYRALIQCFERAAFDLESDRLICLGDVCDGWPETKRCVDLLLKVNHLTYILGNHDTWLLQWMKTGEVANIWYVQGGEASIHSYAGSSLPPHHMQLLEKSPSYFLLEERLFVHAGVDPERTLDQQGDDVFLWDRALVKQALNLLSKGEERQLTSYKEVFVGHTPTSFGYPKKACEVWLMDTGAGWSGKLSMMNVETKEFVQSDDVPLLYPGVQGRSGRH